MSNSDVLRLGTTGRMLAAFLTLQLGFVLAGCTAAPTEAQGQRLDTDTGTTVTLMPRPVELVIEQPRGTKNDPFAYVAPFETNRMGSHELFLWVSAPQNAGPLEWPQIFCEDEPVTLERFEGTPDDMGLSRPPYPAPAPWSAQWYFRMSGEALDCLAAASRVRVITRTGGAEPDRYSAEGTAISGLSEFVTRVRT